MPSWNIHIAQAERVFSQKGSVARTVRDRNAFLFGCFVPDIYVGYMVPAVELPIAYRITHPEPPSVACAADTHVDAEAVAQSVFDLVLGTWLHLVADNLWNTRVNEFLDAIGGKPSEEFRIKKQDDFDLFGKALPIDSLPRVTPRLVAAAAAFPQYPIASDHVHDAIVVTHEIVRTNGAPAHAPYQLLTEDFFEITFAEVLDTTDRALEERLQAH